MTHSPVRVLIVEDDSAIRNALTEKFNREGFTVFGAENGETGLSVATQELPDCILLDILMPKMDGLTMLHLLRQNPRTVATPVILLTNMNELTDVSEALSLGVQDYLVKSSWRLEDVVLKVREKTAGPLLTVPNV